MVEKRKRLIIAARILLVILVVFIVIQFIRPPQNRAAGESPNAIQTRFPVSPEINDLLRRSCYDCHSNHTNYPWYSYIQPVGWFLSDDITEGKGELNFDEFASYPAFRQIRRFEAIRQQVEEGKMPLPSYTLLHHSSVLSDDDKNRLIHWVQAMQDTLKSRYPADSLKRPARDQ